MAINVEVKCSATFCTTDHLLQRVIEEFDEDVFARQVAAVAAGTTAVPTTISPPNNTSTVTTTTSSTTVASSEQATTTNTTHTSKTTTSSASLTATVAKDTTTTDSIVTGKVTYPVEASEDNQRENNKSVRSSGCVGGCSNVSSVTIKTEIKEEDKKVVVMEQTQHEQLEPVLVIKVERLGNTANNSTVSGAADVSDTISRSSSSDESGVQSSEASDGV